MITVVNGYVCTSSCDAASARAGKNPNAPPGTPPGQSGKTDKKSGLDGQPATLLGGALNNLVSAVVPTNGAAPSNSAQLLDLLA
ncbi:MAG TPA: hypothetical protein VGF02_05050 [Pseudolabrys sp.]|jgi:hypothetical protein